MKHLFTCLSLFLFLPLFTPAQSIGPSEINGNGKSVTSGGKTYEYAIGTVVGMPAYVSGSLVVTPGVLQPFTAESNSVDETAIPPANLSVYPNPVEQTLFLKPAFGKKGKLQYLLLDAAGRTIMTRTADLEHGNEMQQIPMSAYALGQYTLNVSWHQQGKTLNTAYKIQKVK